MIKYTEDEKRDRRKESMNKFSSSKKQQLKEIRIALGYRTTKPKKQNTDYEKKRQNEITRLWKLYGWFIEPDIKPDLREKPINENDIEDYFNKK